MTDSSDSGSSVTNSTRSRLTLANTIRSVKSRAQKGRTARPSTTLRSPPNIHWRPGELRTNGCTEQNSGVSGQARAELNCCECCTGMGADPFNGEEEGKAWEVAYFCKHESKNFENASNEMGLIQAGMCVLVMGFCLAPDRIVTQGERLASSNIFMSSCFFLFVLLAS